MVGGIAVDITQRQESLEAIRASEERFRELANAIDEIFWITDPSMTRMLYVSPAYETIWGCSCQSRYEKPSSWLNRIHPEDRDRVTKAAANKAISGFYDETFRIIRDDGSVRWIHDRAVAVRDAAGDLLRFVGTGADITDQRRLEEQVRQAQKMEAIGLLAGGIAHDFNNILACIIGNTELALEDTPSGHPSCESLRQVRTAANRAKQIVNQILAFSRQDAPQRERIVLANVVEESVGLLRASIPAAVEFLVEIDEDCPVIQGDPTQIHQLFLNLCTNAWHAMEDRPGRIEIRLQLLHFDESAAAKVLGLKAGTFACLSVTDNGRGMDAATLEHIFDPFFTTKAPGKGTGLGLSVVHGIVQGHNGAIRVVSKPGRGSTFLVYLPATTDRQDEAAAEGPSLRHDGRGCRILFIDDEVLLVSIAERALSRLGYDVTGFGQGREGLAAFLNSPHSFDVVITDLNMPEQSGLEIASQVLKVRPEIPVFLCSGHLTDEARRSARAVGILNVIEKPSSIERICELIQQSRSSARGL